MLIDDMKKQMFAAMKAGDTVKKELLRTVIGEVTSTGEEATDEKVQAVLKKMVKSARETLGMSTDAAQKATLETELDLMEGFLPKALSVQDIQQALSSVAEQIRAAGNDGQATGIAMKHLKGTGATVDGKDVSAAVKALRS